MDMMGNREKPGAAIWPTGRFLLLAAITWGLCESCKPFIKKTRDK